MYLYMENILVNHFRIVYELNYGRGKLPARSKIAASEPERAPFARDLCATM